MDTLGSTDYTYNYDSPWNAVPAGIGVVGGYLMAEGLGYPQLSELAAIAGAIAGVSIASKVSPLIKLIRDRVTAI